jgi:hypothetical protein
MKQKPTDHVLAFLSLEDFAEEVIPLENLVRVESVTRPLPTKAGPSRLLQWLVIVTARLADGQTAVCYILIDEAWEIFARDETHRHDNAGQAATLVRQYLEAQDFIVGKGILNPGVVMDNVVKASTDLWHFEGITVKMTRAQSCGNMGWQHQFKRRSAVHVQNSQAFGSAGTVHLQSRV